LSNHALDSESSLAGIATRSTGFVIRQYAETANPYRAELFKIREIGAPVAVHEEIVLRVVAR